MIPQTIPSAFAAVSAEIRECELEMTETERHLLRICNATRRPIVHSQETRSSDLAPFAFFIAAAAAIAFAIALKSARSRRSFRRQSVQRASLSNRGGLDFFGTHTQLAQ
jgi:hypothetical protein